MTILLYAGLVQLAGSYGVQLEANHPTIQPSNHPTGLKCLFTIPESMSQERVKLIKQLGAEVIVTPKVVTMVMVVMVMVMVW